MFFLLLKQLFVHLYAQYVLYLYLSQAKKDKNFKNNLTHYYIWKF